MRYRNRNYLFNKNLLSQVIEAHKNSLKNEVENLTEKQIFNTSESELKKYFKEKYFLQPLELVEKEIYLDHNEVEVDIRGDINKIVVDRSRPFYIKGSEVNYYIPFSGDSDLFECSPSTMFVNPPEGKIEDNNLILTFKTTDKDTEKLKDAFEKHIERIRVTIQRVNSDIKGFNDNIDNTIDNFLSLRKETLSKTSDFIGNLGFPLKKRDDSTSTFLVEVPRKIEPVFPKVQKEHQKPEPVLETKQYNEILKLVSNLTKVMERSPKTFKEMGEEDIRNHILVQLNGVYEGQATGETFNHEGKTDILIRYEGKNIFIAECKFWNGEVYFNSGLEQLFGYSAWRDSKLAYIIFNRKKSTTNVLSKIKKIMENNPRLLSKVDFGEETEYRYKLAHPQDDKKEIMLTIMVFDIPA